MGFKLLPSLTFLSLALVAIASQAVLSPEAYWKKVLPNTPMPTAVTELLHNDRTEEKSTSVDVGKGGVHVDTGKGNGGTTVNVGGKGVGVNTGKPGKHTDVGVGKGGVSVNTGKPGKRTKVGVGKGGVSVGTGHKGKPVYVGVKPGPDAFAFNHAATETQRREVADKKNYFTHSATETQRREVADKKNYFTHSATETQLHEYRDVAIFFLEKDMSQGTKMNLQFTRRETEVGFLPRPVAKSIPFSSDKLQEILNRFSVQPESEEAEIMKNTIKECEDPAIKGEDKYCATSLESMVDYSTSKLGKSVEAISTEVDRQSQLQQYTVTGVVKRAGDKAVVCHKQDYPYAVFYCHTQTTKAYKVSLVGADGTNANAAAVCHTDTTEWNPKHLAFQLLKVKPGTVPICHFLTEDNIVWVPK